MILVCGLPSSGNRLLTAHIARGCKANLGDAASLVVEPEVVQLWHGDRPTCDLTRPEGERIVMVIPVRCEVMRQRSVARREKLGGHFPFDPDQSRTHVLAFAVRYQVPVRMVSYEGLVANPDAVGQELFRWLALPWVPWPDAESDNVQRPELGKIYDANEKYRSAP